MIKMILNKSLVNKMGFVAIVMILFTSLMQISFGQEKIKYSDMEKEEISEEGQDALREYNSELLGYVNKGTRFNTIATKENIAVINVTINGKDRRILTKIKTADIIPVQSSNTINLVVLGNISLKGVLFSEVDNGFGVRKLFGLESTTLKYVDEGFSRLVNGKANVSVNPVFRDLISSYGVFLSAEGITEGIYVSEKTSSYFVVRSINEKSNIGFSWMLRGSRKEYETGYLKSEYGLEKDIEIIATINVENETTKIKITGLSTILELINETSNLDVGLNDTVDSNVAINVSARSSTNLITGNVVDEFGLENDLSEILGEATPLPELVEEVATPDITTSPETGLDGSNETGTLNETSETEVNETIVPESILEFTIYSVDDSEIIGQVASVTGLNLDQVRKLINFVYAEPENFEDEIIEPQVTKIDGIEKINGSVRIRLG